MFAVDLDTIKPIAAFEPDDEDFQTEEEVAANPDHPDNRYMRSRQFCSQIYRLPSASYMFDVRAAVARASRGATEKCRVCLLFCFGKRVPWRFYLAQFSSIIDFVVIVGDRNFREDSPLCVTQPACQSLSEEPWSQEWSVFSNLDMNNTLGGNGGVTVYTKINRVAIHT